MLGVYCLQGDCIHNRVNRTVRVIMADVRARQEVVTKFLLKTCQEGQVLNYDGQQALGHCAAISTVRGMPDDDKTEFIPVITGSVAEFYIQPVFPCVGDVDIMFHHSNQLAIPAGTAPPTRLPGEFHSRVKVFEIVDSEFPGYVYLVLSYLLTECIDDGKYNAAQCQRLGFLVFVNNYEGDKKIHGPALATGWSIALPPLVGRLAGTNYSQDLVHCMRCLSWPPQAATWPTRHRNYGWPDSATVDSVVSNGCDVVQVAHRRCRQDGWMRQAQWRLSFSLAEIVLLNSWMPVQQILYHILRVFVKTDREC